MNFFTSRLKNTAAENRGAGYFGKNSAALESGNPAFSLESAGLVFKSVVFTLGNLAIDSRKNGADGAVKLWQILN